MYADKNEKALAFGESHAEQITGRIKILTEKWDNKAIERRGGIPTRFTGLSLEERMAAKLDELRFEIDGLETKLSHLTYAMRRLKETVEAGVEGFGSEKFYLWNCRYYRKLIAKYTGDNPLSYAEEEIDGYGN